MRSTPHCNSTHGRPRNLLRNWPPQPWSSASASPMECAVGAHPATEAEKQAARERFESHFGAVNLGHATGVDNAGIDADLARAYADSHEEG